MAWFFSVAIACAVLVGVLTYATLPHARLAALSAQAENLKATKRQLPCVTLPATEVGQINLRKLNKPVVMVFYPGDNTPGCTIQLCALRDNYAKFQQAGAEVVGVNPASVESHASFAKKQRYPFPLISDPDNVLAKALGVGNTFGFLERTVFVVDKTGVVRFSEPGMPSPDKLLNVVKGLK